MSRSIMAAMFALALAGGGASVRAAPPLEDYGKYPDMEMPRLSPAGDRFAYVGSAGEQRKLFVYTTAGDPVRIIDIGVFKARRLQWAGDDRLVVTLSQTQRLPGYEFRAQSYEIAQVLVLNVATGKQFWVFQHGSNTSVAQAVFGEYGLAETNGHWSGYFGGTSLERVTGSAIAGEFRHSYPDLWKVDLDTGFEARVAMGDAQHRLAWLVDSGGHIEARSTYDGIGGSWALYGESATGPGASQPLLAENKHDPFYSSDLLGMGRNDNQALYQTTDDQQFRHIFEVSLNDPSQKSELFAGEPVATLLFDPQTRLLDGAVMEEGLRTVLFDPARQAKFDAVRKALTGRTAFLTSWNADFSRLIVGTEGPKDPGTFWLIDLKTGHADILGETHPTITDADVGPVSVVHYKAADGLELEGILTLPPGREPKNLPLVVLPHGGPAARDRVGFDWWAQAFAHLGYAVFQPNFRGSAGYGDAFRTAGYGQWGRKMQTDISDGVAALAAQGTIDPKRACIMGGSYGGYAALAGVTVQSGQYRCAVSVAGISDLNEFLRYETDRGDWRDPAVRYWRNYMGVQGQAGYTDTALHALSPAKLAAKADAPVLLIHGDNDTVVPIAQSREMQAELQRAGKPVELAVLPSEDHWLSSQETRIAMLKAAAAFIQKYNPPN